MNKRIIAFILTVILAITMILPLASCSGKAPELEGIKVRLINKDGDLLFEQSYKPQLKTDTDAQ